MKDNNADKKRIKPKSTIIQPVDKTLSFVEGVIQTLGGGLKFNQTEGVGSPQYQVVDELYFQLQDDTNTDIQYAYSPDGSGSYALAKDAGDIDGDGPAPSLKIVVSAELAEALEDPSNQLAVATDYQTLTNALSASKSVYSKAKSVAESTLEGEKQDWEVALDTYKSTMHIASLTLSSQVATAKNDHIDPTGHPSPSAQQDHYYTMKAAATVALATYETTVDSASNKLLAALGILIAAYGAYRGGVASAKATKLSTDAAAYQTYWSAVKGTLTV